MSDDLEAQFQKAPTEKAECQRLADLARDEKEKRRAYQKMADYQHNLAIELRTIISIRRAVHYCRLRGTVRI
jgi:hypothetical protein